MTWYFEENEYNETPDSYQGFVYRITELDSGKKYIGKKNFWKPKILPITKTRKRKKRTIVESDWKKYYGSCPELKEDVNLFGKDKFSREILSLHDTKGQTNFEETRQLFLNEVLSQRLTDETPLYYNSNILGRYYRKDYYNK